MRPNTVPRDRPICKAPGQQKLRPRPRQCAVTAATCVQGLLRAPQRQSWDQGLRGRLPRPQYLDQARAPSLSVGAFGLWALGLAQRHPDPGAEPDELVWSWPPPTDELVWSWPPPGSHSRVCGPRNVTILATVPQSPPPPLHASLPAPITSGPGVSTGALAAALSAGWSAGALRRPWSVQPLSHPWCFLGATH